MRATSPSPARIVVRGLNWLGDAVMSTPALQRLREAYPRAAITMFTPQKLADAWRSHPDVDDTICFAPADGLLTRARRLRAARFDLALIFPNSHRAAVEIFLARVPIRVGVAGRWRGWFLSYGVSGPTTISTRKKTAAEVHALLEAAPQGERRRFPESLHHARHYLRIVAAVGANPKPCPPRLLVAPEEVIAVRQKFGVAADTRLVGFNPGAEYGPAKRWPAERFLEAARRLYQETKATCWFFGSEPDRAMVESLVAELGRSGVAARSLAGRTTLRELCAALKACEVVVTNDTGPMHVAAAVGTRVVVPFGSTSPELTGPGLPGDTSHILLAGQAPCAPCFRRQCPIDLRCLHDISVDQIVHAAHRLLQRA